MSDIKLAVEYCTCCLLPVELCKDGQPVHTYEVELPEEVKNYASRIFVRVKGEH